MIWNFYLLPNRYLIPKTESKDHKYKLQMKKNTVNPKWNAEVNFNYLDSAEIDDHGIEIQMLHLGKVCSSSFYRRPLILSSTSFLPFLNSIDIVNC